MNKVCKIQIASEFGTDLSSRARAGLLRRRIADSVDTSSVPITVDFTGVRTLSTSFADEAFAVLVHNRGEEWFRENVRLIGDSPIVKSSISSAIAHRCEPA